LGGDEYYGFPHLYCHFVERKRQPYERVALFERKVLDHFEFYTELADYGKRPAKAVFPLSDASV